MFVFQEQGSFSMLFDLVFYNNSLLIVQKWNNSFGFFNKWRVLFSSLPVLIGVFQKKR